MISRFQHCESQQSDFPAGLIGKSATERVQINKSNFVWLSLLSLFFPSLVNHVTTDQVNPATF